MKKMLKKHEHFLNELIALQSTSDLEMSHSKADNILVEILNDLGYEKIVDEYNKIDKWYA